jgi:hypothetical protein
MIAFPEWKTAVIGGGLTVATVAVERLRRKAQIVKQAAGNQ